jgi:hypothetical protein
MFESLLMQINGTIPIVTAPPTTTDIGTTITALIVAIGGMLAAVATIIQRLGDRKELSAHKEAIHQVSNRLSDVGQHLISSKEDIKSLAEITYDFSPDKAKELVNQQNVRLQELTKKLEDAQAKLSKVPDVIQRI